jgi:hypothetical protein
MATVPRKKLTAGGGGGGGDALPDDLIREILSRVPDAPALLRCAATCRRWRALVAEPCFLRRCWPDPAYSFLGSFDPKELNRGDGDGDEQVSSFLPGQIPRSALAAGRRLLTSFVPCAAGLPAYHVSPLALHDGLILLLLYNSNPHVGTPLAVCNLLAGTCDVLPPLNRYIDIVGNAVITDNLQPSNFKVLMILRSSRDDYHIHTFVGGQPSWNPRTKRLRRAEHGTLMQDDAVVCQGAAHWLFRAPSTFRIFRVDGETSDVSWTGLTIPIGSWKQARRERDINLQRDRSHVATTSDGQLLSLCLYHAGIQQVLIWTQPAAGHGQDWPCTGVINLKSILEMKMSQICMRGGCGNGKLLIVLARSHRYIANLQTGTMHEVEDDMSSSECMTVVCLETDWRTTFFPARLACTNKEKDAAPAGEGCSANNDKAARHI